jgi:hypothetical protein
MVKEQIPLVQHGKQVVVLDAGEHINRRMRRIAERIEPGLVRQAHQDPQIERPG